MSLVLLCLAARLTTVSLDTYILKFILNGQLKYIYAGIAVAVSDMKFLIELAIYSLKIDHAGIKDSVKNLKTKANRSYNQFSRIFLQKTFTKLNFSDT